MVELIYGIRARLHIHINWLSCSVRWSHPLVDFLHTKKWENKSRKNIGLNIIEAESSLQIKTGFMWMENVSSILWAKCNGIQDDDDNDLNKRIQYSAS